MRCAAHSPVGSLFATLSESGQSASCIRSQKGNPQVNRFYRCVKFQFFFALFNIMMSVKVFALLALVAAASAVELNDDSFDGAIAGKSVSSTA